MKGGINKKTGEGMGSDSISTKCQREDVKDEDSS